MWLIRRAKKKFRKGKLPNCRKRISRVKLKNFCKDSKETQKYSENAIEKREKDQATKSIEVDALVHGAEEGRDKLRKAAGRSKYPVIRRYPNEGTQYR